MNVTSDEKRKVAAVEDLRDAASKAAASVAELALDPSALPNLSEDHKWQIIEAARVLQEEAREADALLSYFEKV